MSTNKEVLYHSEAEGFNVQEFKAICDHCGKVAGMFSTINTGVSHIGGHSFACLDCLRKRYDEGKIAEDIPGAKEFIESLLRAPQGEVSR
jgi:hypothetical protein